MPAAGIWIRIKAFIWDYIWLFIYLCFIVLLTTLLLPGLQDFFNGPVGIAQLSGFLLVTLPISLYFAIGDSNLMNGTFGKRKMGIRVVDMEGGPIGFMRSVFRILLKFLPWELSHFLVYRLVHLGDGEFPLHLMLIGGLVYLLIFTYILTAVFSKENRSLYDRLSGTKVIRI
ncbi:RDD family protein [Planococcus beigongshangi]|uniref:RDD family protein n=1 Tax=Planococcus beigongshangi TaxID=2782536 RepID=UPI00193C7533|nr:RDD family protein [Planococcus beigongshangi]